MVQRVHGELLEALEEKECVRGHFCYRLVVLIIERFVMSSGDLSE